MLGNLVTCAARRPARCRLAAAVLFVCTGPGFAGEPGQAGTAPPVTPEGGIEGERLSLFGERRGMGEIEFDATMGMQFRYTVSSAPHADPPDDETSLGFHFRRLRPILDFYAVDHRLHGFFQAETLGGEATILDMWASYDLSDDWRVRVGQFHLGFSREQSVSVFQQQATDLSSVGFMINQNVGNRLQGAELKFERAPNRAFVVLSEGLSVVGSTYNDDVAEWGATVRYERLVLGESFAPFGQFTAPPGTPTGLMLGLAGHTQHLQERGDRVAFAADLSFQHDGFNALVQGTAHVSEDFNRERPGGLAPEPESAYGVVAHAGVYITDDVEPFIRGEWATTSDDAHPDLKVVTVGVNWYIIGHLLKITTDATVAFGGVGPVFDLPINGQLPTPDGENRFIWQTQLQVVF